MKRIFLPFLILLVGATIVYAQQNNTIQPAEGAEVQQEPSKVSIEFEKTVHDFGTLPYNGDGTCTFIFKNTGEEPLIISNAKASCGCTVPKWPKQPIPPGAKDTIHVKYNTNRPGVINKTITIYSNAATPQVRLAIKGNVEANPNASQTPVNKPVQTTPVRKDVGPVNKQTGTLEAQ